MSDDPQLLDEALARGVITNAQRVQLETMRASGRVDADERIRPVSSFNEIFVTVGVILLLNAASGMIGLMIHDALAMGIASIVMTVAMAEYFHRRKRFRLPVMYGILSAGMASAALLRYVLIGKETGFFDDSQGWMLAVWPMLAGLGVFIAGALRYRVPFIMLPIGILFTVIITFAARHAGSETPLKLLLGLCGLAMLVIAVRFDLKDPARVTRHSDAAFWSYIVGSPLFVHSVFLSVLLDADTVIGQGTWLLVALMVVGVSFAGVLLNRRALILSTMLYVGYVLMTMLGHTPMGIAGMLLTTILLIGVYIIALGTRWEHVRRMLIQRLPAWPWLKHLPPC